MRYKLKPKKEYHIDNLKYYFKFKLSWKIHQKMSKLDKKAERENLMKNLQANLSSLQELLSSVSDHWGYEDPIYRYYHGSFKAFFLQESTLRIVKALKKLAPSYIPLNRYFVNIIRNGTGKKFKMQDNDNWEKVTRPIVEAFFHARYMLEMACKYGEEIKNYKDEGFLNSGFAAFLYLYNLR